MHAQKDHRNRPWTPDHDHQLRRLARTSTSREIAAALGRTQKAIKVRACRLGVSLQKYGDRRHGTKWPDALVDQIRTMHEAGTAPVAIARDTGVPIETVRSLIYYKYRFPEVTT